MAYFRQTDSIEDLKEQYKRLLTKFDYKDPKNAKLLEAIDKEYKQCQIYAKMAPLRNAKKSYENKLEEARLQNERNQIQEEQNRKALYRSVRENSSRKYTKEEFARIYQIANNEVVKLAQMEVKYCIKKEIVGHCKSRYEEFNTQGYRRIYINLRTQPQWALDGDAGNFISAGNDLECAIVAITTVETREKTLQQFEERLGKKYVEAYMQACEEYMDSIDYARLVASSNRNKKFWKVWGPIETMYYAMVRIVGSIVIGGAVGGVTFLTFVMFSDALASTGAKNGMQIVGAVVALIVAIKVIKPYNDLCSKASSKGLSRRQVSESRITEIEKMDKVYQKEEKAKTAGSILRVIAKLFGI